MSEVFQILLDEREIVKLALRYAAAVDDNDLDAFVNCFSDKGIVRSDNFVASGHDEIRALVEALWRRASALQHLTSNFLIDIKGSKANMRADVIATHVPKAAPDKPWILGAVYFDRLERLPQGWRFVERSARIDWSVGDKSLFGF